MSEFAAVDPLQRRYIGVWTTRMQATRLGYATSAGRPNSSRSATKREPKCVTDVQHKFREDGISTAKEGIIANLASR